MKTGSKAKAPTKAAKKTPAKKAVKEVATKKAVKKAPAKKIPPKATTKKVAGKSTSRSAYKEVAELVAKISENVRRASGGDSEVEPVTKDLLKSAQHKSCYEAQLDRETIAEELLKVKSIPAGTTKQAALRLLATLDVGVVPGQEAPLNALLKGILGLGR
jgi:hypothetical protein